jgi:hypothetical protein
VKVRANDGSGVEVWYLHLSRIDVNPNDPARGISMVGLAFSGLAQGTGLALLIAGAVSRQRVPVYAANKIQLTPVIGPASTGFALSGNF